MACCKAYIILIFTCITVSSNSLNSDCRSGEIRLQGGRNIFEGHVEMCYGGMWKNLRVCNRTWGVEEAKVVCRQLGFSGYVNPIPEHHTSALNMPNRGSQWNCNGTEMHLLNCSKSYYSMCTGESIDAGVYCFGRHPNVCTRSDDVRLRLVGASDVKVGRVEICLNGLWGTVCDDGWDSNDATVVCRQLRIIDNNQGAIPTRRSYFGSGSGPIHFSQVMCTSSHLDLRGCNRNDRSAVNCTHKEDAGVICLGSSNCTDGDVRLVDGDDEREGRVEICYNGVWGTVCAYGWDQVDANVVCTQLGYGTPGIAVNNSGVGDGPILFDNVSCNQYNSKLSQCVHMLSIGQHQCDRRNTAGVICPKDGVETAVVPQSTNNVNSTMDRPIAMFGALVGGLSVGIIAAVIVTVVLVILTVLVLKRKSKFNAVRCKKESMDNPTYDENIVIGHLPHQHDSNESQQKSQQSSHYKSLSRDTKMSPTLYDNLQKPASSGDARLLEATYAVPEDAVGVCDDSCYSVLGPADYAILEPHIPEDETQQHDVIVGGGDDYSHLQHI